MKDNLKWTKSKVFLISFNCILCISIVVSAMMIVIDKSRIKNGAVYTDADGETQASDNAQSQTTANTLRLMIAGDNTVYKTLYSQASERSGENGYNFLPAYEELRDIISKADIAMISQNTVMDDKNSPSAAPEYNSPNEILDALTATGFDVFNQANDHIMDMGISGVINDIALFKVKEQSALLTGLSENKEEMLKPKIKEVNGIKVSFVGITESVGNYEFDNDTDIGILDLSDSRSSQDEIYGTMKQLVTSSKSASDIVCVTVHWDNDDSAELSDSQQNIISTLLEYGADIIIGTGKNTTSAPEFRKNGDSEQALVVPSLGKVISLEESADSLLSGIADVTITKDPKAGTVTVSSAKMIPIVTVYETEYSNLRVVPFSKCTEEIIKKHGFAENNESFTYSYIKNTFTEKYGDKLEV